MNVCVLSINFKQSPIEILEACSCNKDDITFYLNRLISTMFFDEMVIISTCNRTEWVFTTPDSDKAINQLTHAIAEKSKISKSVLRNQLMIIQGREAINYLFELSCGLKSMVLGENEILAQIKNNYSICMEFGATKSYFNKLFQSIISTGKDARYYTGISKGAHSISSIAIEAIKKKDNKFLIKPMLLVGAGVMIQRAIAKLSSMNHQNLWISNRTMSKAEELVNNFNNLNVIPYASIPNELHRFNTIYVGISSPNYLFNKYHFMQLNMERIIVDVGIPRSVDPKCNELDNISLISIDKLENIANETISKREGEITLVHTVINKAINELYRWVEYRNNSIDTHHKIAVG